VEVAAAAAAVVVVALLLAVAAVATVSAQVREFGGAPCPKMLACHCHEGLPDRTAVAQHQLCQQQRQPPLQRQQRRPCQRRQPSCRVAMSKVA
jgi:hypothetical protein